jgi:hypothetical protein
MHLAHATGADQGDQFIRPETGAGSEGQCARLYRAFTVIPPQRRMIASVPSWRGQSNGRPVDVI